MALDTSQSRPENRNDLALVFATFQRPHTSQRLINSVRKYFPEMPIYVAVQSDPSDEMKAYYRQHKCEVAWVEHDCGVCVSRNAAVDLVKEPYFLLCDDDFFFGPETRFDAALDLLDHQPDIGIVGGRLFDRHFYNGQTSTDERYWELFFNYDPEGGRLTTIPVHYFAPEPKYSNGIEYYECDAVMNFAVFRTDIINKKIRWDPQFKSNGEHEDFYLNFKLNGRHRVAYTPTIVAYHNHPVQPNYQKLRFRNHGWQKFLDKWKLRQFLEIDGCLRVTNSVHLPLPYATGYNQYYSGVPLDTRKQETPAGCLRISNFTGRPVPSTRQSKTSVSVIMQFDMDGNVAFPGGSWKEKPGASNWHHEKRTGSIAYDVSSVKFELKCPGVYESERDFFCYLYPLLDTESADNVLQLEGLEVFSSVAVGSDYVVFLEPVLIDSHSIFSNQWNALPIALPPLTQDIYFEIVVTQKDTVLYSSTQAMKWRP